VELERKGKVEVLRKKEWSDETYEQLVEHFDKSIDKYLMAKGIVK
jgi:hypothetical protein